MWCKDNILPARFVHLVEFHEGGPESMARTFPVHKDTKTIHTHRHTYIHTHIRAYLPTYIHASIHAYMHT